ncbi:MAG: hypothetical protein HFG26_13125 [Provencibacterium sp.]|jgi:hypothetical protein|nr:hypothetical protein [Provencibacterium sp.]
MRGPATGPGREERAIDLRNYEITVGEILQNPKARAELGRRYPQVMGNPMLRRFSGMPLRQAMGFAQGFLPAAQIRQFVRELEKL